MYVLKTVHVQSSSGAAHTGDWGRAKGLYLSVS